MVAIQNLGIGKEKKYYPLKEQAGLRSVLIAMNSYGAQDGKEDKRRWVLDEQGKHDKPRGSHGGRKTVTLQFVGLALGFDLTGWILLPLA